MINYLLLTLFFVAEMAAFAAPDDFRKLLPPGELPPPVGELVFPDAKAGKDTPKISPPGVLNPTQLAYCEGLLIGELSKFPPHTAAKILQVYNATSKSALQAYRWGVALYKEMMVDVPIPEAHNRVWIREELIHRWELKRIDSLSLVSLHWDKFTQVNWTYGHSMADEMLLRFGRFAKEAVENDELRAQHGIRSEDIWLVRWGGDEFYFVIRNAPADRVASFAAWLVKAFAEQPFLEGFDKKEVTEEMLANDSLLAKEYQEKFYHPDHLTISVGVSTLVLDPALEMPKSHRDLFDSLDLYAGSFDIKSDIRPKEAQQIVDWLKITADKARAYRKNHGRNGYAIFDDSMLRQRVEVESIMTHAPDEPTP